VVDLPWRDTDDDEAEPSEHADAVVACEFQDGTMAVYEDEVVVDRPRRSKFVDTTIPAAEITGVDYSEGITVGYLQVEQAGVKVDRGGMFSDPINRNTVHFGRGQRECAREARDAILERAGG